MKRALAPIGFLVLALGGATISCSEKFESSSNHGGSTGNTGEVGLELEVGSTHVSSASYILSNVAHTYQGTVEVGDASQLLAVIGGIAAGTGYTLTIHAIGSNGVPCNGASAPFTVVSNATVIVGITLICRPSNDAGSVKIEGTAADCAAFSAVSAGVPMGNQIQLSATTIPAVPSPPASISWLITQGSGTLSSTTGPNPVYTCDLADEDVLFDVTLTQSGVAACTTTFHLIIDCPPTDVPGDGG